VERLAAVLLAAVALSASLAGCGSTMAPAAMQPHPPTTGPQANCAGFHATPGVDDRQITIANASDLSGSAPDRYASAQEALRAFVAYFNSTSSICGRRLNLLALDSRADAAGDKAAAAKACQQAFALVGSMSSADLGGAGTAAACGIPDLRAATTHAERADSPVVYAARTQRVGEVASAVPDYFVKHMPDAVHRAALVYVGAQTAARSLAAGYAQRGFQWIYQQGVDATDFNYTPYVMRMRELGVRYVQFVGPYQRAVRLAQAMRQQGLAPEAFVLDANAYDPDFVTSGGAAVDGVRVVTDAALFEESATNPELQLYTKWLTQEVPGAVPSYVGLFAWSAARLFTDTALQLGGQLTRDGLLERLATVKDWDGHGLTVAQDVGGRHSAPCASIVALHGGAWQREADAKLCGDLVQTGTEG
jgi:ABC-type branched-subunit amino acid transport system substrate-binding protein